MELGCVLAVNRIINRTNAYNEYLLSIGEVGAILQLTGKRVQRLLYVCKLLWLAEHDTCEMIPEDFEVWHNGAVIPKLYDYILIFQEGRMLPILAKTSKELTAEEKNLINAVVDSTMYKGTESIIDFIMADDGLWASIYKDGSGYNKKISQKEMREFMKQEINQNRIVEFITSKDEAQENIKKKSIRRCYWL